MRADWLRSTQARSLLAVTFGISLVLGGAFLAVDQLHATPADALKVSGPPLSDGQSRVQAVGAAADIVSAAQLRPTSAGYLLMSCRDRDNPPYQGAVYLTFTIPADTRADAYLPAVAKALAADGWVEGRISPGGHPYSRSVSKNAVTALIYRDDDNANLGVARVYGECRNTSDHRTDSTGWVDVTGEIRG
ncbi:MAG: hypothetical protein CK429_17520 [Mycobacterium sp.]|jgi:hypothetical protein|uniref:hypothetical protein n=1 Tax=Mycobacterium TaxID=1763 RepID=UPI0009F71B47|nr:MULTISPECIES: hypothetical protein [Mycobacterium]MBI2701078.1 hypothetical protein [Mycobacterium sp.]MCQ4363283.1 hypothetical protein [Mycobacterium gordonae]PJE01384.1 MAG: hypothetical protein CK428_31285 [Mycobacterium sp.]PJE11328.1 MAG: hypothetical protein CK429_17520 [Mycobacterium sp.]